MAREQKGGKEGRGDINRQETRWPRIDDGKKTSQNPEIKKRQKRDEMEMEMMMMMVIKIRKG